MASYMYKLLAFTIMINLVFGMVEQFNQDNSLSPESTIFDSKLDNYNTHIKTLKDEPDAEVGFIEGAIDKLDATVGNTLRISKTIWKVLVSAFDPFSLNDLPVNDRFERFFLTGIATFRVLIALLTGIAIYQLLKRGTV